MDLRLYTKNEETLDSLFQTVRVFRNDISMHCGLDKFAVLTMKRGKIVKSNGIELPNDDKKQDHQSNNSYKYMGILESNEI